MKQILYLFIIAPFFMTAQINRGGEGGGTSTPETSKKSYDADGNPIYATKGEKPANCNEDLELDPGNNLIYHKKTRAPYTGLCVSYFPNGRLERKARFINGKDHDTAYVYYESGDIQAVLINVEGVENGTWGYWYDNGADNPSPQQVAWGNTFAMGSREGEWLFFAEDGKPTKVQNYKNDKLDGVSKTYYKSGNIKKTVEYKDGDMHGAYTMYYEDSVLKSVKTYKNGKIDEKAQSYYESGALKSEFEYKNGSKEGKWTTYYENGQIKSVGNYEDNFQNGLWEMYQEDGKNQTSALFDEGVVLKTVEYDRFGKPKNDLDVVELNNLMSKQKSDSENSKKKKKKKKKGDEVEIGPSSSPEDLEED
jgi:antitoxin component YwqK of YwqJK toxin-antitoxin module